MSHLYSQIQNQWDRPPVTHLDRGDSGSTASRDNSSISEITLEQGLKPPPRDHNLLPIVPVEDADDVAPESMIDADPSPRQQQHFSKVAVSLSASGLKNPPPSSSLVSLGEEQEHEDQHYEDRSIISEDDSSPGPGTVNSIETMQYSEISSTNDSMPERSKPWNQVDVDPISEEDEVSRASSSTPKPAPRNDQKYKWYIGIALIVAVIAIIVAVVVVLVTRSKGGSSSINPNGGNREIQDLPTNSPSTMPPTMAPTKAQLTIDPIEKFLMERSFDGGAALTTDGTPQNRAFMWLSQDPNISAGSYNTLQRYALATLYYATGGNRTWLVDHLWLSEDHVCEWNNTVSRETRCSDDGKNLLGISAPSNQLMGSLPSELALANELLYIEFYLNELEGPIPVEYFTQLPNLSFINLFFNNLSGSLPTEIGLSTLLSYVDLDSNNLDGTIPTELGLLTDLKVLWLNNNKFTGLIPAELGNLDSLEELYLDSNQLTGSVPDAVCNLPLLTTIMVGCDVVCTCCSDDCDAKGEDAQALLEALRSIAFDGGAGLATVDSPQMKAFNWLGNRATLISLSTDDRVLLYSLATFYYATGGAAWINATGWLEDDDPCTWFGSDGSGCTDNGAFQFLHLRGDNLIGALPVELAHISTLTSLQLQENNLLGFIPKEYFTNLEFKHIELYLNFLTGELPSEIGLQTSLTYLDVESNLFQASIPTELGLLSSIEVLWLSGNLLNGSIPSELSDLSLITQLYLSENKFFGVVPLELCGLKALTQLEVDCNLSCACCSNNCENGFTRPPIAAPTPSPFPTMSGPADSSLVEILSLVSFDEGVALKTSGTPQNQALNWLQSNTNVSNIPEDRLIQRYALATIYYSTGGPGWTSQGGWLGIGDECLWYTTEEGNAICDGDRILVLDLDNNNMIGSIPPEIGLLSNLLVLDLFNNFLTGTVPASIGKLTNLAFVCDFDSNLLRGTIPTEFGNLKNLTTLWLNDNLFNSTIPSELALMNSLQELYLHQNDGISGSVSDELCMLGITIQVDCVTVSCSCCSPPCGS